ncbi:MAG: DoxX family protein [Flavobacteriaceae bacterium]
MIWIYRLFISLVSGTVFYVWLLNMNNASPYRGGVAVSLKEEFLAYGLSESIFYLIGGIKLLAALSLFFGLRFKRIVVPSTQIIAVLMIGAIAMHLKVADPLLKSLPAIGMLSMCLIILRLHKRV